MDKKRSADYGIYYEYKVLRGKGTLGPEGHVMSSYFSTVSWASDGESWRRWTRHRPLSSSFCMGVPLSKWKKNGSRGLAVGSSCGCKPQLGCEMGSEE